MKNRQLLFLFHLSYVLALLTFTIFFYFEIKNIFLTYCIIISSALLLLLKLKYWYSIKSNESVQKDKRNILFFRILICVFLYFTPAYFIIQEPFLVVNKYISTITFVIVTLMAIIGLYVEKWQYKND